MYAVDLAGNGGEHQDWGMALCTSLVQLCLISTLLGRFGRRWESPNLTAGGFQQQCLSLAGYSCWQTVGT